MTELLTVSEVRDRLPASNRPSERTLREQLLAAGCAVRIGRRVYTSSVMWDRFLCQTVQSARISNRTAEAMSGMPAAGSRAASQTVQSPADELSEALKAVAARMRSNSATNSRKRMSSGR